MAPDRPGSSLRFRLAALVFVIEAALLAAFALTVYWISAARFLASFDDGLRANAEALGSLVEDDEHEAGLEFELADEFQSRFSRPERPDLFAVFGGDGTVVARSRSLAETPPVPRRGGGTEAPATAFAHRGERYRGLWLDVVRASGERPGQEIRARVFFAASTRELDSRLGELAEILVALAVGGLVLSGALAGLVAWRGLGPLQRLARETGTIGGECLDRRLETAGLPREIRAFADSVNGLLGRLEAAFERERRFSSDAAHELRTPLATLKSGIQAALLEPASSPRERRVLEPLLEDVVRLEELCDALLLVASAQARQGDRELDAEDWSLAIEEVVRGFRQGAAPAAAVIHLTKPDTWPASGRLRTSRAAARRIATNLIENAIRHGGPDVRIDVAVSASADGAELLVQDDGPGVASEDRPRLFERFFRADRARSRATGGAGLGLAICQSLATAHGGRIRFDPVEPHGCRFFWSVARAPAADA
ncbi:MAG: sensor histidine kinase N-terminal domain-containing protein [Planctomycetes bacterium]|nr:sensor histidine kinase N-terminal domain-containing protein [Planctomycetota bacterium]